MDIITIGDYTYFIDIEWRNIIINGKVTNYDVNNIGNVRNRITGKILSTYTDNDGYIHSTIVTPEGRQYHPGVHRFVATAFIPNPENKPEVNHKNGVKYDNCVENLEWATTSENIRHAFSTGLKSAVLGEANSLSVYTEKQIRKVCKLLELGVSNKIISKRTGVDRKYITDIKKGRRWKHISDQYNIVRYKYPPELKSKIDELIVSGSTDKDIIDILSVYGDIRAFITKRRKVIKVKSSTTIEKTSKDVTE